MRINKIKSEKIKANDVREVSVDRHACGFRMIACLLLACLLLAVISGCGSGSGEGGKGAVGLPASTGKMELQYATQFEVEYLEGDYALITIGDDRFLMVPEGAEAPSGLEESIKVIHQPFTSIYLAASSAMDYFRQLDALSAVTMTSTKREDWSFKEVQDALDAEEMFYIGKYSAPDYETIVDENCGLAIESTMIYHSPSIKEKLETMGIPVMVERSSYEPDPLGRMEWIKLYGLLTGKSEEADKFFEDQIALLKDTVKDDPSGKTVAFFYVSSSGSVNVRKPGDYISKMIDMAGASYILSQDAVEEEDNALSTMNMDMESFYNQARDADILIYNSTIEGGLDSVGQLIEKNKLFADFKAVKEGHVWCTDNNTFQQATGLSRMISEFYAVFHDQVKEGQKLEFLYPVH